LASVEGSCRDKGSCKNLRGTIDGEKNVCAPLKVYLINAPHDLISRKRFVIPIVFATVVEYTEFLKAGLARAVSDLYYSGKSRFDTRAWLEF